MSATEQEPKTPLRRHPDPSRVDELIARWQRNADRSAREELVIQFMPMARRLASRYRNAIEPTEDLVQVAGIGLLGAIDRYDPTRGTAFSSFAVPTILGELKRHFRNTGWSVHVPRGGQELALRIDRAVGHLTARHGRTPTLEAVAEHLSITVEDALEGLEASAAHYSVSLDAPIRRDDVEEGATLADTLGAEDGRLDLVEMSASLSAAIDRLPHLERQALALRVQHDMKQSEIGAALGCSQMQVSRLLRRASVTLHTLTRQGEVPPVLTRRRRSPRTSETI